MKYPFGCLPDPADNRDINFADYLKPQKIPQVIDWSSKLWPVRNQGSSPSCVGQSGAGLKTCQECLEHNEIYTFDGENVYQDCKTADGNSESGTSIRTLMKVLRNKGACWKKRYYKIDNYAKLQRVPDYEYALAGIGPFVLGIAVFPSMENPENGVVDLPPEEAEILGYHAVLACGYDKEDKKLKILNSWGNDWANGGYALVTYGFLERHVISAWSAIDATDKVVQSFLDIKLMKQQVSLIDDASESMI